MSAARVRLMSLTESDFYRLLPVAVAPHAYASEPGVIRVQCGPGEAAIRVAAQPPRRIASLTFPVLRVEIEIDGMSAEQAQEFLERFDRAFHRGGG